MSGRALIAGLLLAAGGLLLKLSGQLSATGAGQGAGLAASGDVAPALQPVRGSDQWVVAQTIWGEARGQGRAGMAAVADVIRNRVVSPVTWWGSGWRGVCLAPRQFSVWNAGDPNLPLMQSVDESDAHFRVALDLAGQAMDGTLPAVTGGATHYYNPRVVNPAWASALRQTAVIGNHRFLV